MAQHISKRRGRVRAAKKKIVELVKAGTRINLARASDFTVAAIRKQTGPGSPAAKEMFKRADVSLSNQFDNSVSLTKRRKSTGHR